MQFPRYRIKRLVAFRRGAISRPRPTFGVIEGFVIFGVRTASPNRDPSETPITITSACQGTLRLIQSRSKNPPGYDLDGVRAVFA